MIIRQFKYISLIKFISLIIGTIIIGSNIIQNFGKSNIDIANTDIVYIIDLSHSMNVKDVFDKENNLISRLELTKDIIQKISSSSNNNIRQGLIIFSRQANYYIPPTLDNPNLIKYVKSLNTGILPAGGTNIAGGIQKFAENSKPGSIGIFISDMGENQDFQEQQNQLDNEGLKSYKQGLKLIMIGVGSKEGGVVQYPNEEIITQNGQMIKSARNDENGKKIAKILNSTYQTIDREGNYDIIDTKNITQKSGSDNTLSIIGGILIILGII